MNEIQIPNEQKHKLTKQFFVHILQHMNRNSVLIICTYIIHYLMQHFIFSTSATGYELFLHWFLLFLPRIVCSLTYISTQNVQTSLQWFIWNQLLSDLNKLTWSSCNIITSMPVDKFCKNRFWWTFIQIYRYMNCFRTTDW